MGYARAVALLPLHHSSLTYLSCPFSFTKGTALSWLGFLDCKPLPNMHSRVSSCVHCFFWFLFHKTDKMTIHQCCIHTVMYLLFIWCCNNFYINLYPVLIHPGSLLTAAMFWADIQWITHKETYNLLMLIHGPLHIWHIWNCSFSWSLQGIVLNDLPLRCPVAQLYLLNIPQSFPSLVSKILINIFIFSKCHYIHWSSSINTLSANAPQWQPPIL